jgi:hypothetical protein
MVPRHIQAWITNGHFHVEQSKLSHALFQPRDSVFSNKAVRREKYSSAIFLRVD